MKWVYKVQKFMIGRYGVDELYQFLFRFYLILFIIDLFISSKILNVLELIIIVIMFYRLLSKNISKRKNENNQFLKVKKYLLKPIVNIKRNFRDRDYYVYKKCHKCNSTLKLPLPSKRGVQHVKCPTCKKRLTFLCFRKEKIEVIKEGKK